MHAAEADETHALPLVHVHELAAVTEAQAGPLVKYGPFKSVQAVDPLIARQAPPVTILAEAH